MARDFADSLREKIREYEDALASMRETLRKVAGLESKVPPGVLTPEGKLIHKPDAWNVADDIRLILDDGKKSMLRDDLIRKLVDEGLVKGGDRPTKIAAARRAITRGVNLGYLRIKAETVHWVPGVYENERLQKKL